VDSLPAGSRGYARDTITLGWEERLKARGRRRSDAGVEFGTALPRGSVLRAGDCLVIEQAALVVEVVEQEEPVFIVAPRSAAEWGLYGYCIGNSHQPLMLTADAIVCPDVPGMEQVLTYHGIPYVRGVRPFTPAGVIPNHRHVT
jgi:urease accessory protein